MRCDRSGRKLRCFIIVLNGVNLFIKLLINLYSRLYQPIKRFQQTESTLRIHSYYTQYDRLLT